MLSTKFWDTQPRVKHLLLNVGIETMKALRWHAQKDIRVDEVEEATAKPGCVKLKVHWCGICGTDLHEYEGGPVFIPTDKPHPLTGETAPVTLGHEFAGEILEIGEGVEGWNVGDRVVVEPLMFNPKSRAGRVGLYNLCDDMGLYGLSGMGGGFSEYACVPVDMLHRMPENVSYEQGALVEPAAVAFHAVRRSRFKAGDNVAVFGAGPIGLLTIESLKAAGANKIYAIELSEERCARAEKLGATVLNPAKVDNIVDLIVEETDGGVDVAFEVTGVAPVLQQAIDSTKMHGEAIVISVWTKPAPIQPNALLLKERSMTGVFAYCNVFPAVLNLMAQGYFNVDDFVTDKVALNDVVEKGFHALLNEKDQVKILVSAHNA